MKNYWPQFRILAVAALAAVQSFAFSGGPPPGRTGAPPGTNCTACHAGAVNSGSGSVKIEFANGSVYTPGVTYKVRVTLADPQAQRWGFEMTARIGAERLALGGSFSIDNATTTQFSPGSAPGEYVCHTSAGTSPGTTGSSSWEVNWTAPAAGSGPIVFFAAGNAANGNGANSGDSIYTTSLVVNEAGPQVTGTSYALPQLAFGGGWYTALYFTNTTDAATTIGVKFYGADGAPIVVPLASGSVSETTASIPPKGTVIFEAPNTGSLQQGWARAILPAGVTGYGVFRQSVQGRLDQEAVVPLSEENKQMSTLIWDDTTLVTALAVVNPSTNAVAVNINVRKADGSAIGTVTLNLPAGSRQAFVLRDQQGLAAMVGQRGAADISVQSNAVAALGLRFSGAAFTSIPVQYR